MVTQNVLIMKPEEFERSVQWQLERNAELIAANQAVLDYDVSNPNGEALSPFGMGQTDARDGMDYQPSSYYCRYSHMRQYADGFLSVSPDDRSALGMVAAWDADDEDQAQLTFPWRR